MDHSLGLERHLYGVLSYQLQGLRLSLLLNLHLCWLGHDFCLVVKIGLIIDIISGLNIDLERLFTLDRRTGLGRSHCLIDQLKALF